MLLFHHTTSQSQIYLCIQAVRTHCFQPYHLTNDLLPRHKSAYRLEYSIEIALTNVLTDLTATLDRNDLSLLALLDLTVAFDTVNHSILLIRLETSFGTQDFCDSWIRSNP